jgi:hypothetical protein
MRHGLVFTVRRDACGQRKASRPSHRAIENTNGCICMAL